MLFDADGCRFVAITLSQRRDLLIKFSPDAVMCTTNMKVLKDGKQETLVSGHHKMHSHYDLVNTRETNKCMTERLRKYIRK